MDDIEIVRRVQDGDVEAYALLVRTYHHNLLNFIYRIVKDRHLAEDIGQETFLKIYRELSKFDPARGTPFSAWLYLVARNQAIDELRKAAKTKSLRTEEEALLLAAEPTAEMALIRQEEMAALQATLRELPEPFRTTILMSLQGGSLAEISRQCGVGEATVKTRLFRAREKMGQLLQAYFGGIENERRI